MEEPTRVAGWYDDPFGRHEYRYWDGTRWTATCSDDGRPCHDEPSEGGQGGASPLRLLRLLWWVYALPFSLLAVFILLDEVRQLQPLDVIDAVASLVSLVVLWLYILRVRVLGPWVWRVFAVAFVAWELYRNLVLGPSQGDPLDGDDLFGALVLLPLYVSLFLYAFGRWTPREAGGVRVPS